MTGNSIQMNRTRHLTVLGIAGGALLVALVLFAVNAWLALGTAGFAATCVAWVVVTGITSREDELCVADEASPAAQRAPRIPRPQSDASPTPSLSCESVSLSSAESTDVKSESANPQSAESAGVTCELASPPSAEPPGVTMTQDLFFDTLTALALALETRDPYSRGGTARVMKIALSLGDAVGLDEADVRTLKLAVLLHDIGMPAVGDAVAVTRRPLTTVEWAMLKMHPQIAAEILSQAPMLGDVVPLVYHHHERYDGSGYGDGLVGQGIPLGARILAVADAFVAMTSSRPYRSAMNAADAMTELTSCAGTQFDPTVVDAFAALMDRDAECFAPLSK